MSVDKLIDSTQLDADLTSVANAIRTKTGKNGQLSFPSGFVSEINDITPVVDTTPIDDVTFVDYDGTVLHTYSADEFLVLSAMPSNPSHAGLVAQGWNWTLAGAKEYVAESGCLCIGQNYTTDNGDTRIYVNIQKYLLDCPIKIGMYTSVKGGVRIDWGDGTIQNTTANANVYGAYYHTYETAGKYIISLRCTDGNYNLGYSGANTGIFVESGQNKTGSSASQVYKVEIGNNCDRLNRQSFTNCYGLKNISIPNTVIYFGTSTSGEVFRNCHSLACMVFPKNSTIYGTKNFDEGYSIKYISFGENMIMPSSSYIENNTLKLLRMYTSPSLSAVGQNFLSYANSLEKLAVPGTYTTLANTFCRDCYKIRKFVLPTTVTTIPDYSLTNDRLKEFHVRPTTPPTIANTRGMPDMATFGGIIYVPYSADHSILEAYQTATNWSTYAQYMQEEPQS